MAAITVAITTHNLEKYIEPCLRELMAQTFQDFDILVYDDCSADRTREILAQFQTQPGDKLQVILGREPQKLPARARNAILRSGKIRGKYIVFLDGDDSIEPDFLEQLYTAAESRHADLALCAYDRFEDESGKVLCQEMRGYPPVFQLGAAAAPSLALINTSLWNKLIRCDRLQELYMPEFSVGEDAAFLQSIYMRCQKIACVDQILIHYRVRAGSVISNTPEESIYSFARELHTLWLGTCDKWMKDNLAFAAFIHIGLSMPIRAYDNPNTNVRAVLGWVRRFFSEDFHWFRGNPYLKLPYLLGLGFKGICIYAALICHKLRCFPLLLGAYKAATTLLHMDIKF
ncbi:MAG: glycosyltransferase family 2 protein [Ruminococcaceae bacterium]|nr:glycosyltransferase family 2 protein [Oscillospiraceae bacterium]